MEQSRSTSSRRLALPRSFSARFLEPPAWFPLPPAVWEAQQLARRQLAAMRPPEPLPLAQDLARDHRVTAGLPDRWYVIGKTKSGKTTFTKRLIKELRRMYPHVRLYVLDSKGAIEDFGRWPGIVTSDTPPRPLRTPGGVQVWQPPTDDVGAYGAWLEGILKARTHAIVYIDELSSLSTSEGRADYPHSLAKLIKQGARLGIAVIALTQEAAYIPRQVKTQASHFVRFHLQADDHAIAQATRLLGMSEPREPRKKYGFWYRNLDTLGPAFEYGDLTEFFTAA